MKNLTKLISAVVLSTLMTTSVMAQTTNAPVDMSFAFDDAHSLQVQDMNTQQMQETEGAFFTVTLGVKIAFFAGSVVGVYLSSL